MAKALRHKKAVPATRKKSAVALKAKPKILKKSAKAKVCSSAPTDRIAGIEKSILSIRGILEGIQDRLAVIEWRASQTQSTKLEVIESKANAVSLQLDQERISNLEDQLSDLRANFDTRIDQAIIEIAERIENHTRSRRNGTHTEPRSGALASRFAKFEETGLSVCPRTN